MKQTEQRSEVEEGRPEAAEAIKSYLVQFSKPLGNTVI
jgi:hypothetical protein